MNSLDTPHVRRYSEAAERYRAVISAVPQRPLGQFLHAIEPALSALYSAAAELPDLAPDSDGLPDRTTNRDVYLALQGSLAALLGRHDAYHDIFDPSDPEDQKPVQHLLSLDLTEILEDLDDGRNLMDSSRAIAPADVLWQWRFDFTSHWGRHAATALKVINSLLHTQFVDTLEEQ
jgi:Domain of unknown function (DUF5063)